MARRSITKRVGYERGYLNSKWILLDWADGDWALNDAGRSIQKCSSIAS